MPINALWICLALIRMSCGIKRTGDFYVNPSDRQQAVELLKRRGRTLKELLGCLLNVQR